MHNNGDKRELESGDRNNAGLPAKFILDAFWMQWRFVLIPWQALVFWISCCTSVMVKFLTAAGAPPVAYKDKLKLKETQKLLEHLHQREDGFRRKLKELQVKVEMKGREVKRLEIKLAKAQRELASTPTGRTESAGLEHELPKPQQGSRFSKHFFFLFAGVLPTLWLLQQQNAPSISRKFAWCIISPEALLYVYSMLGGGPRAASSIIQFGSLFLSGFVFCHWLHAHC